MLYFSVISGGEHLLKIVNEAVPRDLQSTETSIPASEISVLILDYLYNRLNEVSHVQGGEVRDITSVGYSIVFLFNLFVLFFTTGGTLSHASFYLHWKFAAISQRTQFVDF